MGRRKEAIDYTTLHAMRRNVMALTNKTAAIHPIHLTHDDVLHLTAPEEHHGILRKAASVARVRSYGEFFQIAVPTVKYGILAINLAMVDTDDVFAPLQSRFPSYIVATPQGKSREISSINGLSGILMKMATLSLKETVLSVTSFVKMI